MLIITIAIVIDIGEKIDNFLQHKLSVGFIIKKYYINFIPWIGMMLSSLFVFISVVFFTSRMSGNSEFIAALAGGVNFYRLLVPYLMVATVLMFVFIYFNHEVVPRTNLKKLTFEDEYVKALDKDRDQNFHLQIAPDTFFYLKNYNERDHSGYKFSLEGIKDKHAYWKLTADRIKWHADTAMWELTNIIERKDIGWKETITEEKKGFRDLGVLPEVLEEKVTFKETMTTKELKQYIIDETQRGGVNLSFFYVELYKRTSVPVSTIILTVIGVALTSRKMRGGIGMHIVLGVLLAVTYIVVLQFAVTFATKGNLDPLLASWLPNILFGIISVVLLIKAPK